MAKFSCLTLKAEKWSFIVTKALFLEASNFPLKANRSVEGQNSKKFIMLLLEIVITTVRPHISPVTFALYGEKLVLCQEDIVVFASPVDGHIFKYKKLHP